jgi:PIN domain nuclease of toxin-antitoxin system
LELWEGFVKQHLDTHVAVWIAAGDSHRLKPAQKRISRGHLFVSPIVVVEMEVLREIGRLTESVDRILQVLEGHGVRRDEAFFAEMMIRARALDFTRDPFDRFIAAHALASNATLLTADQNLLTRCTCARWS